MDHYAHATSLSSESWHGSELTLVGAIKDAILTYNVGAEDGPIHAFIAEATKVTIDPDDLAKQTIERIDEIAYEEAGELHDRIDPTPEMISSLATALEYWMTQNITINCFTVTNEKAYGPGDADFDQAVAEIRANNLTKT